MPLKLNPDELPTINLTSMIDVVFLLLIFFMVGTRFSESETKMAINLPRVSSAASMQNPPESKIVNLYLDGSIEMDSRRMSLSEVTRTLSSIVRKQPQTDVVVRPDGSLPIQRLSEVMQAIHASGVHRVNLSSRSNLSR